MSEMMLLVDLLGNYEDGDGNGWTREMQFLRTEHPSQIAELTWDIKMNGIREPIQLGHDGRVWDGHHRITVADALDLEEVPVVRHTPPDQRAVPIDDNAVVQALRAASAHAAWNRARQIIRGHVVNEIQKLDHEFRNSRQVNNERSSARAALSAVVAFVERMTFDGQ